MNSLAVLLVMIVALASVDGGLYSHYRPKPPHHFDYKPPRPKPCGGFLCPISKKCVDNSAVCNGRTDCNNGYTLDNTDELNCAPYCCDDPVVLNYTTISQLFDVGLANLGKCESHVTPSQVNCAFKGSEKKFTTKCSSYDIIINVTADTNNGMWNVCYISYKTDHLISTSILIDSYEFDSTSSPVSLVVNTTASGHIVIHVESSTDNYGRCIHDNSIYDIEIILCRPPSPHCFLEPIITPAAQFDSLGNPCLLSQDVTTFYCNGTCPTQHIGARGFTNTSGTVPLVNSMPDGTDCTCCYGTGVWQYYPIVCTNTANNSTYTSTFGIYNQKTCDCNKCPVSILTGAKPKF